MKLNLSFAKIFTFSEFVKKGNPSLEKFHTNLNWWVCFTYLSQELFLPSLFLLSVKQTREYKQIGEESYLQQIQQWQSQTASQQRGWLEILDVAMSKIKAA